MNFKEYTPEEYDTLLHFAVNNSSGGHFIPEQYYYEILPLLGKIRKEEDVDKIYEDIMNYEDGRFGEIQKTKTDTLIHFNIRADNFINQQGGFSNLYGTKQKELQRQEAERKVQHEANLATVSAADSAKRSADTADAALRHSESSARSAKIAWIVAIVFGIISSVIALIPLFSSNKNNSDIKALKDGVQHHQIYFDSFNKTVKELRDSLMKLRDKKLDTPRVIKPKK